MDFDGTIYWNGEPVSDRAALEDAHQVGCGANPISPRCICARTSWSRYAVVAEVMASAQRLGVTKIGMVGNEQFIGD